MRCAVIDANGVFLGMEEVATPTERHLPRVTQCDLPPREYFWAADAETPYGGAFWPLPPALRLAARAARKG